MTKRLDIPDSPDGIEAFFGALSFVRSVDRPLLCGFRISELITGKTDPDYYNVPLKDADNAMWHGFLQMVGKKAVIGVREYYDEYMSVFSFDKNKHLVGALLVSDRGNVLFVDKILTFGKNEPAVTQNMISFAANTAKKAYTPGTEVGIIMANKFEETTLKDMTDGKAEKVGHFTTYLHMCG